MAFRPERAVSSAAAKGYPFLQARGEVLRRLGIDFHDMTRIFAVHSETLYRDLCCHYNWRGNQILGRATAGLIADALDRDAVLPTRSSSR